MVQQWDDGLEGVVARGDSENPGWTRKASSNKGTGFARPVTARVGEDRIRVGCRDGPVALVAIDERDGASARIGHVGADVKKVFEEPEDREG
jgi:hypothetical protein